MFLKNGINYVRSEKRTSSISLEGETSCCSKRIVICKQCHSKFEKQCPNESICKVINTKCPKCGGILEQETKS